MDNFDSRYPSLAGQPGVSAEEAVICNGITFTHVTGDPSTQSQGSCPVIEKARKTFLPRAMHPEIESYARNLPTSEQRRLWFEYQVFPARAVMDMEEYREPLFMLVYSRMYKLGYKGENMATEQAFMECLRKRKHFTIKNLFRIDQPKFTERQVDWAIARDHWQRGVTMLTGEPYLLLGYQPRGIDGPVDMDYDRYFTDMTTTPNGEESQAERSSRASALLELQRLLHLTELQFAEIQRMLESLKKHKKLAVYKTESTILSAAQAVASLKRRLLPRHYSLHYSKSSAPKRKKLAVDTTKSTRALAPKWHDWKLRNNNRGQEPKPRNNTPLEQEPQLSLGAVDFACFSLSPHSPLLDLPENQIIHGTHRYDPCLFKKWCEMVETYGKLTIPHCNNFEVPHVPQRNFQQNVLAVIETINKDISSIYSVPVHLEWNQRRISSEDGKHSMNASFVRVTLPWLSRLTNTAVWDLAIPVVVRLYHGLMRWYEASLRDEHSLEMVLPTLNEMSWEEETEETEKTITVYRACYEGVLQLQNRIEKELSSATENLASSPKEDRVEDRVEDRIEDRVEDSVEDSVEDQRSPVQKNMASFSDKIVKFTKSFEDNDVDARYSYFGRLMTEFWEEPENQGVEADEMVELLVGALETGGLWKQKIEFARTWAERHIHSIRESSLALARGGLYL